MKNTLIEYWTTPEHKQLFLILYFLSYPIYFHNFVKYSKGILVEMNIN